MPRTIINSCRMPVCSHVRQHLFCQINGARPTGDRIGGGEVAHNQSRGELTATPTAVCVYICFEYMFVIGIVGAQCAPLNGRAKLKQHFCQ